MTMNSDQDGALTRRSALKTLAGSGIASLAGCTSSASNMKETVEPEWYDGEWPPQLPKSETPYTSYERIPLASQDYNWVTAANTQAILEHQQKQTELLKEIRDELVEDGSDA